MPTTVEVPNVGEIEFPDEMSEKQIASVLNHNFNPETVQMRQDQAHAYAMGETQRAIASAIPLAEGGAVALSMSPAAMLDTLEKGTEAAVSLITGKPMRWLWHPSETMQRQIFGKIPEVPTKPGMSTAAAVGAGTVNAVVDFANFIQTPEFVSFLGIGGLPKAAQQAALADFSGQMMAAAPEQFNDAYEKFKMGDIAGGTRAVVSGAGSVAMSGAAGRGALAAGQPALLKTPKTELTPEQLKWSAEQQANLSGLPGSGMANERVAVKSEQVPPKEPAQILKEAESLEVKAAESLPTAAAESASIPSSPAGPGSTTPKPPAEAVTTAKEPVAPAGEVLKPDVALIFNREYSGLVEIQKRLEEAQKYEPETVESLKVERDDIIQRLGEFDRLFRQDPFIKFEDSPEVATAKALRDNPSAGYDAAVLEGQRLRKQNIEDRIFDEEPIPDAAKAEFQDLFEQTAAPAAQPAEVASTSVQEAVSLAQFHDPSNMGALLGAYQHVHKSGYTGYEAQSGAWTLYASQSENPTITTFGDWVAKTKRIEELMRQQNEVPNAISKREAETVPVEVPPGRSPEVGAQVREQGATETPKEKPLTASPETPRVVEHTAPLSFIDPSQAYLDEAIVKRYQESIRKGEPLEPVSVIINQEIGKFSITDGHHRYEAAKREGLKEIPVQETIYPYEDKYTIDEGLRDVGQTGHAGSLERGPQPKFGYTPGPSAAGKVREKPYAVAAGEVRENQPSGAGHLTLADFPSAEAYGRWAQRGRPVLPSGKPILESEVIPSGKETQGVQTVEPAKASSEQVTPPTPPAETTGGKVPFEVDDKLVMRSPHTGDDTIVSYRGKPSEGQAVVWTGKTQMQVPESWLRRQGEKYERQVEPVAPVSGVAKVEETLQGDTGVRAELQPTSRLSKQQLVEELIGPKPSSSDYRSRIEWDKRRRTLSGFTKPELVQRVESTRKTNAEQAVVSEGTQRLIPEIQKLADDAGQKWRTALNERLDAEGIKYRFPADNTKGEGIYNVARAISERRAKQSTPPPAAETGGEIKGMGGAVPGEFKRSGGSPSSARFASIDADRQKRGLEPLLRRESVADQAVMDKALARYDRNPSEPDLLAKEIIDKPRSLTDEETMLLQLRRVDLRDQFNRSAKEAIQASDDGRMDDVIRANAQTERWDKALQQVEQAIGKGGSETGAALRIRRLQTNDDFSLAGLSMDLRKKVGWRKLTEQETRELQKIADEYKAQAEEFQAKYSEEGKARQRAEAELDRIRKGPMVPEFSPSVLNFAEQYAKKWDARGQKAKNELADLLKGEGLLSGPLNPEILDRLAIWGASKIVRGVVDVAKMGDALAAEFSEKLRPFAQQVWDAAKKAADLDIVQETKRLSRPVAEKVKQVLTEKATGGVQTIRTKIAQRYASGQLEGVSYYAQKLARAFVEVDPTITRDALIDRVHSVLAEFKPEITKREAMDAISGYGDYSRLTKDATSVILRDLKGQMQQIGKLEDMAGGEAPKKTGLERRVPSDEERRLIQQVEERKKEGGFEVTDPESQLRTALQSVKKRLENQISDLEHQIATREKIVKKRTPVEYDEQATALKARRDELKATFDEVFPKEPITEAERLQRWTKRTEKRIAEIEDRIVRGDFSKRTAKPPPTLDPHGLVVKARIETIKRKYMEYAAKKAYENMTTQQKAWVGVKESLNIPRNVMTSGDVSAVLRQGAFFTLGHPVQAAKNVAKMIQAMGSEHNAAVIEQQILHRNNAANGYYTRGKVEFTSTHPLRMTAMEEQVMSKLGQNIPLLGKYLVKPSNRAFTTFLNLARADGFDALVNFLERKGTKLTDAELRAIGNYVNVSTGRGNMGKFAAASEGLSTAFFSPRLVVSRFQLLAGQPMWRGTARTRMAVAGEYGKMLAGMAVIYGLARIAGATIEADPRSSDFGKLRFGNTRIDPLAGLSQVTVLLSRLASGETKNAKGKVLPIRGEGVKFGMSNAADISWRFLRSKFSPVIGAGLDIAAGENVVGEKVTPGGEAANLLIPLSFQDVFKVMREQGIPAGTAMMILSAFGMGLQYYEPKPTKFK